MASGICILLEGLGEGPGEIVVRWRGGAGAVSERARRRIARLWAEYRREARGSGASLFNGAITYFRGVTREGGKIVLELGPASYRDFVVTVLRDRAWFFEHGRGAMRPALGNSVLLTQGDEALLGVRSGRVSAYAGRAHVIGGVLDRLGREGLAVSGVGIVKHLRRELWEEAGVRAGDLVGGPRVLAVGLDRVLGQPELIWRWELRTGLREVAGRLGAEEHQGVLIIGREKLEPGVRRRMTPVARAAWERWRGC